MPRTEEILTAKQTADELDIAVTSFYKNRCDGKGPLSYRRGNRLYVFRSDLDAYLAAERECSRKGEGVNP